VRLVCECCFWNCCGTGDGTVGARGVVSSPDGLGYRRAERGDLDIGTMLRGRLADMEFWQLGRRQQKLSGSLSKTLAMLGKQQSIAMALSKTGAAAQRLRV